MEFNELSQKQHEAMILRLFASGVDNSTNTRNSLKVSVGILARFFASDRASQSSKKDFVS